MSQKDMSAAELVAEVNALRARVRELEQAESEYKRVEKALIESEARFRTITESTATGVYIIQDDKFRYVNPALAHIFDYEPEELIDQRSPLELTHPNDREDSARRIQHRIAGKIQLVCYTFRGLRKNGTEIHCESRSRRLEYHGRPAILGTLVDITDREAAERRLRLLSSAIEQCSEGVAISDLQGNLLFVNHAFATMHGYTPDELAGKHLSCFHSAEQIPAVQKALRTIQAAGSSQGEIWHARRDSTEFPTLMHNTLVQDEAGNPIAMISACRDTTEQKRAQEKLRKSEREKALILASVPEHILHQDSNLRIIWANRAAAESVGQTPEQLVGRHCHEIWHHRAEPCPNCPVHRAMETGEAQQGEIVTPDARIWFMRGYPTRDENGNITGAVEITQEITERKKAEEALRASEARYRETLDAMGDAIHLCDRDLQILLTNSTMQQWADRLDIERDMIGRTAFEVFPFLPPSVRDEYRQVFETGKLLVTEEDCDIAGRRICTETRKIPLIERGKVQRIVTVIRDITERKKAEEALRASEARYRAIVEDQTELICRFLPDTTLTFVNEAYCRYFGATRDALEGRSFLLLIPEEDQERVKTHLALLGADRPVATHEHRITALNGEVRWQQWTNRAILDERGAIAELQAVGRDITNRKRAEEALRESEELYRTLIETSPDGTVLIDLDGRIMMANQRAADLFGLEKVEEALGKSAFDFIAAESRDEARRDLQGILKEGSRRNIQYGLLRKDGSSYDGELGASTIVDSQGRPKGFIVVVRDVTERNRLQQQLLRSQKLESIGTLAGGIAHDFNNLLAVIVGNVSVLQRHDALPARVRDALEDIMGAAERGSALTHQLLAYARGGLQKPAPIDLHRVIRSVLQILERTASPRTEFVLDLPKALPLIMADATQIEQVVMNLCLNAIQASQPPSTIEITTAQQTLDPKRAEELELAPGPYARLHVKDRGCGMDTETMTHLFEPFFTTKPMGRGMGLAATQGIVHSHHGQIRAESAPGRGTTMSVWLPVAKEQKPVPETGLLPKPMEPPHGSETVLAIDDDAAVTKTVEQILSSLGYCVVSHTDADEALAFLEVNGEDVDLILMNLHMPKHSGADMLAQILKRCPQTLVLVASGLESRDAITDLTARGAAGFVAKPFSLMTLATAVRDALDKPAKPAKR